MAGDLTLVQMRDELMLALDNRPDLATNTVRLDRWLRWGILHISNPRIYRHRELQTSQNLTMVTGTYAYAINPDVYGIYTVRNTTNAGAEYKLWPRDYRWMQEIVRTSGRPTFYALFGRSMYFHATPDSSHNGNTINVAYWKRPAALASSGVASELAPEWDEPIVAAATWRAWRQLNQPERAVEARENLAGLINEIGDLMRLDGEDSGFNIGIQGADTYMRRG